MDKYAVIDLDNSRTVFDTAQEALEFLKGRERKKYVTNIVTLPIAPQIVTIHFIEVRA